MIKIVGIIPSRYGSTRFPGKPLALIKGKSLIERVWKQAKKSRMLTDVIIATDDKKIKGAAEGFGAKVVMTPKSCRSGTDRLAVAVKKVARSADIVINIQGDEPLIPPGLIDSIAIALIKAKDLGAATAAFPFKDEREVSSPNVVKVVFDKDFNALYFSRCPVPFQRCTDVPAVYYKHIGIYGYRKAFLFKFAAWKQTPLEKTEQLEQLRILENGEKLKVVLAKNDSFGVDVPADIQKIERLIK